MPCNWSTTTSFLSRRACSTWTSFNAVKRQGMSRAILQGGSFWHAPVTRAQLHPVACIDSRNSTLSTSPMHGCGRAYSAAVALSSPPHANNAPQSSLSSALASTTAQLSAAQVSRAAAQAVRLCIKEGGFGDALYVVNSACHSVLRDPLQPQEDNARNSRLQPISFGRPVSPRLAAHAFLHGLIRGGYTRKANVYAKLMIEAGITIRTRTLESVITTALSRPSTLLKPGPFARMIPKKQVDATSAAFKLQTGMVTEVCARAALELLQTARTFGQQRTERMYRVLVETLLMQGEIIVASLLFVLLLQDWELRKIQEGATQEATKDRITYDHLGVDPPHPAKILHAPYPDLQIMGRILEVARKSLAGISDNEKDLTRITSLQSLALFAMLLDTGQLHTHRVAVVIHALYNCPKTNTRVWILRDGELVQVGAYRYFHDVLNRLVRSLSTDNPPRPLPTMSRRSYNALLMYSLRHRLSPAMGSIVLQHMCVERKPPLRPDIVTFNILLRSGTLMRKLSLSEGVLAALRLGNQELKLESSSFNKVAPDSDAGPSPVNATDKSSDPSSASDLPPSDFTAAVAQLSKEDVVAPEDIINPIVTLEPNNHTLTSFITHLTSTGRPDAIATVLFDILPELNVIDHPATNDSANVHTTLSYTRALKQAVVRGPYLYAALINALVKAGEIGLAERVFILAQQAAIASSLRNFVKEVKPWRLSVHAFTSLLQGYVRLALGHLPKYKRDQYYVGTKLLSRDILGWEPKARHYDAGYAQFVYEMREENLAALRKPSSKRETSRRHAMLLYRSMMLGARSLLTGLISRKATWPTHYDSSRVTQARVGRAWWWKTKPDARFFNVALKLFSAASRAERSKLLPSRIWHKRLRNAKRRYGETGEMADGWTPMLHHVARAMVAHGFDVPVAYRHLLVGKWKGSMKARRKRPMVFHRPYAFPPARVERREWPHSLPTVKTRGLPVRRRWRKRTTVDCESKPVSQ
ncbi:hypothetical protein BD311DRAFT_723693 [Dichomitus squalens]|uniref:Uncharacterized protein n=1 Tax=Dichomitus squalens TaxID=114155 RepID=A0A4Q9MMU0_9APHY|nr:hypothetical protein BD311DRAFT_723693 [Dichomitus squalens]